MSTINGASGGNYISNAEFLSWMQEKTDGIYGKMRGAMDVSNDRAKAEEALNKIKGAIADLQAGKMDGNAVYAMIDEAMQTHGKELPGLADVLKPIADELVASGAKLPGAPSNLLAPPPIPKPPFPQLDRNNNETKEYAAWREKWGALAQAHPERVEGAPPKKITIDKETATRWSDKIKDQVEAFGKEDQLGLINIQEFNAQLNQAKQTASALMDAADKAANAIISHIS